DCRRFCRIFHWTVCRIQMGIICEPYGFFGSLFHFSLGGLDICGVDDRTKEGRSGCGCGKRRAGLGALHYSDLARCPLSHAVGTIADIINDPSLRGPWRYDAPFFPSVRSREAAHLVAMRDALATPNEQPSSSHAGAQSC